MRDYASTWTQANAWQVEPMTQDRMGLRGKDAFHLRLPTRRVRIGTVRVTIGRLKYVLKHFEFDPMPIWVERCRFGGPGQSRRWDRAAVEQWAEHRWWGTRSWRSRSG